MKTQEKKFKVKGLIEAYEAGSLVRNPEYQRGAAWTKLQKARFIDSIMRGYPVPAIFLHLKVSAGLDGEESKKYEIVDGQQRLLALTEFRQGRFKLLPVGPSSKLRIPLSVLNKPAEWADKFFEDWAEDLRVRFLEKELTVFQVGPETDEDEVRDLFIRLQSGTALSRQQIRDAWPGNIGPFVERLAGKLDKSPQVRLFELIDKRGQKGEDEDQRDRYVTNRLACAQLLRVYLTRLSNPWICASVSAQAIDDLYHEHTEFDTNSSQAKGFVSTLNAASRVLERAASGRTGRRKKHRRLDITALMMFFQDIDRNPGMRLNDAHLEELAQSIAKSDVHDRPIGRSTSASTLQEHYEWFRNTLCSGIGIALDDSRSFSEDQKSQIWERDQRTCGVCGQLVEQGDDEYDHFPTPHRDGGKTEIANGRLVHKRCHPRGRPSSDW